MLTEKLCRKGPVMIYRLGGGGDFWENKRGIAENSGRIQRGTTQICLQNEDRGDRESHQKLLGGSFQ